MCVHTVNKIEFDMFDFVASDKVERANVYRV